MVRTEVDTATLLEAAGPALGRLADPELVTLAGDFHAERGWAKHVVRAAGRAGSSVLVPLGDFGVWRTDQAYLQHVNDHAEANDLTVLFVDGNHEDFEHLEEYPIHAATGFRVVRPNVLHAPRGTRWTWRGLRWLALGGATSLDKDRRTPGSDWFAQEALTSGQVYRASMDGTADVMVTHDCPAGVPIPGLDPRGWSMQALEDADAHRWLMRSAVDAVRPTHLFHGHYHVRHSGQLDLGDGLVCQVEGLDRDGSMTRGYLHLDLDVLTAQSFAARP